MDEQFSITVMYFYDRIDSDVDNILKPIQDALIGLIYNDDSQIHEARILKRHLSGSYRIKDVTAVLAEALVTSSEFVYVKLETIDDLNELEV